MLVSKCFYIPFLSMKIHDILGKQLALSSPQAEKYWADFERDTWQAIMYSALWEHDPPSGSWTWSGSLVSKSVFSQQQHSEGLIRLKTTGMYHESSKCLSDT